MNDAPLSVETLSALIVSRHPTAERDDKRSMASLFEQVAPVEVTTMSELECPLAEVEPGQVGLPRSFGRLSSVTTR